MPKVKLLCNRTNVGRRGDVVEYDEATAARHAEKGLCEYADGRKLLDESDESDESDEPEGAYRDDEEKPKPPRKTAVKKKAAPKRKGPAKKRSS